MLISLHSLHIVLDNPLHILHYPLIIVLSIVRLYVWSGWGLASVKTLRSNKH